MNTNPKLSAQPCGCDPGATYKCKFHESIDPSSYGSGNTISRAASVPLLVPDEIWVSTIGGETRVKDPITGGEKGMKLARFSLIPFDFLWALAEHYGRGAFKYDDRNWEKGYKWSLSLDALQRHLALWVNGEDNDAETGSSHLVAVAWHVIALWWWHKRRRGTDDIRSL